MATYFFRFLSFRHFLKIVRVFFFFEKRVNCELLRSALLCFPWNFKAAPLRGTAWAEGAGGVLVSQLFMLWWMSFEIGGRRKKLEESVSWVNNVLELADFFFFGRKQVFLPPLMSLSLQLSLYDISTKPLCHPVRAFEASWVFPGQWSDVLQCLLKTSVVSHFVAERPVEAWRMKPLCCRNLPVPPRLQAVGTPQQRQQPKLQRVLES